MNCGYPASSIRERIYADAEAERFGILLYTGSPDADGPPPEFPRSSPGQEWCRLRNGRSST